MFLKILFCLLGIVGLVVSGNYEENFEIISPSQKLELKGPISIEAVNFYSDGGTTGVFLKDSIGEEFNFCFDGRMRMDKPGQAQEPRYFFINADYPTRPEAESIPKGGKEEKSILNVLQATVNAQFSPEQQEGIFNRGKRSIVGLSDEEFKIYCVLNLIEELKIR